MTALEPSPIVDRIKAELKVFPIPPVRGPFVVFMMQMCLKSRSFEIPGISFVPRKARSFRQFMAGSSGS